MIVWYFVLAAIIAVVGMLYIYQSTMKKVESIIENRDTNEEVYEKLIKLQPPFFIKHAVIEIVPLILVVLAFMSMDNTSMNPYPLILAVAVWFVCSFLVYRTNKTITDRLDTDEFNSFLGKFMMIEFALMSAFPVIAVIGTLASAS